MSKTILITGASSGFGRDTADDLGRAGAYGAVGEMPGALFKHFVALFRSSSAPNPHDVADAITKLVGQPKGTRPARTVVGSAFGSDTVNEQTAPVQAHVIEALGLAHLSKLA
jgi:NAD(P)-dependent dehydrogenase (short-subunit alcohol dehydrogenase family)